MLKPDRSTYRETLLGLPDLIKLTPQGFSSAYADGHMEYTYFEVGASPLHGLTPAERFRLRLETGMPLGPPNAPPHAGLLGRLELEDSL